MIKIKKYLLAVLYSLKYRISRIKLWLGIKLGFIRSVMIMPYLGFGNDREIFFPGRVLRDRGIGISQIDDSRWRNFIKMYKRFFTWSIPEVNIKAEFHGAEHFAKTDEEGYFQFRITVLPHEPFSSPWQEVKLELMDQILRNQNNIIATNQVFIPSTNVEYGVISDIDDTIVPTGATRLWEMLKTTFLGNAHSRIPFPGVSAFYNALALGSAGRANNPFFYISSSPWNLYDFLMEFMMVHHIPKGPLMLRDIGLSRENFISGSHFEHKLTQVERIFEIVHDIPFILIGDSGQHDAEIYLQVIKDYPGRVKMIYIRDVAPAKHDKMVNYAEKAFQLGVDMMLVNDTLEAARHAVSKGWIRKVDISDIAEEKTEDEVNQQESLL